MVSYSLTSAHPKSILKLVLSKGFCISPLHMCVNKHQFNSLTFLRTICILTLSLFSETKALTYPPHHNIQKVPLGTREQMGVSETLPHPHCFANAFFLKSNFNCLCWHLIITLYYVREVSCILSSLYSLNKFFLSIHHILDPWVQQSIPPSSSLQWTLTQVNIIGTTRFVTQAKSSPVVGLQ